MISRLWQRRIQGIALAFLSIGISLSARAITEAEKYYDRIKIFNEVLSEVQEKYVNENNVETGQMIENAIGGMLQALDPYSSYMPPQDYDDFQEETRGTFGGLGITIDLRDGWITVVSPLPDTPAFREGILAGDKIIEIEGETTKGMDITDAVHRLRGEVGTKVTITIFRPSDQSTVEHTIERGVIRIPNIYVYTIDGHIGYVRLLEFKQTASSDLNKALNLLEEQQVDGLILDLRFNSGGLLDMAVEVSDKFLPKDLRIVSIRGRDPKDEKVFLSTKEPQTRLPLVLLVNQASASASEIVAGAMQDHGRAILVGPKDQRTFGKGSVQTVIPLSNDAALKLTTAKYFTPLGRSIEDDKGLEPDIKVDIDEKFQRDLIMQNRLAKLPESIAVVKQIYPDTLDAGPSLPDVEAATDEISPATPSEAVPATPVEETNGKPEIYDKELAKALEILKTHSIWAKVDSLMK